MTDKKVVRLFGGPQPTPDNEPDAAVISVLEDLLERAKDGSLRSVAITGFMADGARMSAFGGDTTSDIYSMTGAITWLGFEYANTVSDL